jgi:hypothetical protein
MLYVCVFKYRNTKGLFLPTQFRQYEMPLFSPLARIWGRPMPLRECFQNELYCIKNSDVLVNSWVVK